MKAVLIREFTDPKNLKVEEITTPQPSGDEVLIAVKAAAINPSDVKNASGSMHGTTLPRVPGRDFAGIIVAGVKEMIGREVWGTGGDISRTRDGSHAEYILLPKAAVTLKPEPLSMELAATAGLSFITGWSAMVTVAQITKGETAVIIGASGSVGSAAAQIAKSFGARVIAVVRSDEDIEIVRKFGVDEAINSRTVNLIEAVNKITGNRGAQVVFDSSGMLFAEAVEIAANDARIPVVAASPEGKTSFNLRALYRKMLHVDGIDTLRLNAVDCARLLTQMIPNFESGQFKSLPAKSFPLNAAAEAYQQAAHGGTRVILQPNV